MNGIAIDAIHGFGDIPMLAIPVLPYRVSMDGLAYKLQYRLIMNDIAFTPPYIWGGLSRYNT